MNSESARRRLHPRVIDTDWLVLRTMRPAIERLAAQVARPGNVVVDFGCGTQPYRQIFDSHGAIYHGVDLGDGTIDDNGRVRVSNSSADVVTSFQVLEHVRDVDRYLAEANRILRDDGWLLLSTHGSWLYHPHPEDHRRWTREGLVTELAAHGFETKHCIPVLGPLAWTTLLRLTGACYLCAQIPFAGRALANTLAVVMNLRGYLEDLITPDWMTRDNACVYVTLSRLAGRVP